MILNAEIAQMKVLEKIYVFHAIIIKIIIEKMNIIQMLIHLSNVIVEQEGYYFDLIKLIYMPCYSNCKECNEYGNNTEHKCIEIFINFIQINNNCYPKCEHYYYFDLSNEYKCTSERECPDNYNLIEEKNQFINNCNEDNE